jgi:pimeloyl-ACP methyl ester carboxylesterase
MFEEIKSFDARQLGTRFDVPFFLFQGEEDVITLTNLAVEYFNEIEAPMKQLVLIKNAGHFAAFTQPDQFLDALLAWVRPLEFVPVHS